MKLLALLIGGLASLVLALPLLTLAVVASMPWLALGALSGPPVVVIQPPAPAPVPGPPVPIEGRVTDVQRYQLARGAGFSPDQAITATAISIAEDTSGDPAALSGVNGNGTRDLGLWQINSSHWADFGGQAALVIPATNAHAAFVIFGRQGWCAWSTYGTPATCFGIAGHTNAYAAYLERARAAAQQAEGG